MAQEAKGEDGSQKFEKTLSKTEFVDLFMNSTKLNNETFQDPPSVIEICELFEFLDKNKEKVIKKDVLVEYLLSCHGLKEAKCDVPEYCKLKHQQQSLPPKPEFRIALENEIKQLIKMFALSDNSEELSPEEFFNIIMYAYGY